MSTATGNVIARKMSSARVSRSPIPQIEDIGEDFAKLLDERLRKLLKAITSSIVLGCEVKKLARVLETIPVPAMLGVITVRNAACSALVNISNDLIYHIVDLRMGGDSETSPVPTARSITALDCTLCHDFIDTLLSAFTAAVAMNLQAPGLDWMQLRQFEQHVTMTRIAPENADVLVLNLSLDLGAAARSGDLDLIIPLSVLDSFKAASQRRPDREARPDLADLWSARMARAAREAPIRLDAVLHRLHLDLRAIQAWREGDVISVPETARGRIELQLHGQGGMPLATGRLGAVEGQKAVKLATAPDGDLVAHLRRLTGERRAL
jgi:flagellar motor switch protein FliM